MQDFTFTHQGKKYSFNPAKSISLAISVQHNAGPVAYGMDKPNFEPFRSNDFVASIAEGGNLNCFSLKFFPHGSGTHTETLLHASSEGLTINQLSIPALMPTFVVSVLPEQMGEDAIISKLSDEFWTNKVEAVIIRTLPNSKDKFDRNYTNQNPPFFSPELMDKLVASGVKHFLTDLPSVDKEVDGGKLLAHKSFFNKRKDATITELIFVPDSLSDGLYLLNLQLPSIVTDAVPSQPVLFELNSF